MKKLFAWFGVIILTFAFGIFSTLTWLKFNQESPKVEEIKEDLPILAVCELVNNPEKYSGKEVRLSANLHWYMHGYFLEDWNCHGNDESSRIAIIYNKENADKIDEELERIRNDEKLSSSNEVNFIVVGKFEKLEKCKDCSDAILDRTQLHFEIIEIEKSYLDKR